MWKNIEKGTTEIAYDNKNLHITELEDTRPVFNSKSLYDIFSDLHGKDSKSQICNIDCKSQVQGEPFQVEGGLTVGDVASFVKLIVGFP
jgi:hypothetical protein